MTSVTVQLSAKEIRRLKSRTGKHTANAALRAWIAIADRERTAEQLRTALAQSRKEEAGDKGRRFRSGRDALRWLES